MIARKKPQRMCVSCRERHDKKDLLRVVIGPDGDLKYDPTGKASGRGAYLCRKEKCIVAELKAHRLAKGLKHDVDDQKLQEVAQEILKLCAAEEGSND